MKPKINQLSISDSLRDEDTLENNYIIRSLTKLLTHLIEKGAPLNPDSIVSSCYENKYNTGKENEYSIFNFTVTADFTDSKQIMWPAPTDPGYIEESAKKFGFRYQIYLYLNNTSKNYAELIYICSENNCMDINKDNNLLQWPAQRHFDKISSSRWSIPSPYLEWVVNTIKDGETFYFGFEMISPYPMSYNYPIIEAAFTPVKSLSDPTKKLDYCFFTVQNACYPVLDNLFYSYGGYLCRSYPEIGSQLVQMDMGGYYNASPVGSFIEADETNKVVLLPIMIGIGDYYLDKIYLSNITRKNFEEEAVELDKGVFLISGANFPLTEESKNYQVVALFDITESMSQEEE